MSQLLNFKSINLPTHRGAWHLRYDHEPRKCLRHSNAVHLCVQAEGCADAQILPRIVPRCQALDPVLVPYSPNPINLRRAFLVDLVPKDAVLLLELRQTGADVPGVLELAEDDVLHVVALEEGGGLLPGGWCM